MGTPLSEKWIIYEQLIGHRDRIRRRREMLAMLAMLAMLVTVLCQASLGAEPAAVAIDGPQEVAAGEPAWFRITGIPANADAQFFPSDEVTTTPYLLPRVAHFWTKTPGTYRLNAVALVIDWESKTQSMQLLTTKVKVTGRENPPPPPVSGDLAVVIVGDRALDSAGQTAVRIAISHWAVTPAAKGLWIRNVEPGVMAKTGRSPTWWPTVAQAIEGKTLPAVVFGDQGESGAISGVVDVRPLPATADAAVALIESRMRK